MERKLTSVVKIVDIQPIVGADAIVVAKVKGWNGQLPVYNGGGVVPFINIGNTNR